MIKPKAAALAAFALFAGSAQAQEVRELAPGASPAPATLADFQGLIGNWYGPTGVAGFTMTSDNQIVGHLELGDGKAAHVEELWIFRPDGDSVLLSQKHFGADLSPHEDYGVWSHRKLVAIDPGHIYLEDLTWIPHGDSLTLLVRSTPRGGGAPHTATVEMQRVK
jgi:hypothetical protein